MITPTPTNSETDLKSEEPDLFDQSGILNSFYFIH